MRVSKNSRVSKGLREILCETRKNSYWNVSTFKASLWRWCGITNDLPDSTGVVNQIKMTHDRESPRLQLTTLTFIEEPISAWKPSCHCEGTCRKGWDFNKVMLCHFNRNVEHTSICSKVCSSFDHWTRKGKSSGSLPATSWANQ